MLEHKTAKPGVNKPLAVTAPLTGISSSSWGLAWMDLRAELKLNARSSGTLLPACSSDGGWSAAPLRTGEFGSILRSLLVGLGCPAASVANVGAHSLKTTTLAWAAKFGISKEVRRDLGYHTNPTDKVVAAYSRDVMAGPLRQLSVLLVAVSSKSFRPDASRSGRFDAPAASPAPASPSPLPSSSSDSSGSCDENIPPLPENGESDSDDIPLFEGIVRNLATGVCHIESVEPGKLKCGKELPFEMERLVELPVEPRLCTRCF